MTAVWNKLTTQLSTWLTEPNKWKRREGETNEERNVRLRSTNSLSTLNQKHLIKATAAARSKSSENLNKINLGILNNKKLLESLNNNRDCHCLCCPQSTTTTILSSPSNTFSKALNNNKSTSTNTSKDILNNGICNGGKESGYSSASPSRRKNLHKTATIAVIGNLTSVTTSSSSSSSSHQFFQKFRSRDKNNKEKDEIIRDSFYCCSCSSTANTSSNINNNTNNLLNRINCTNFNCCCTTTNIEQKKGWWCSSDLKTTRKENTKTQNEQQEKQKQNFVYLRRPSEPTILNEEQQLNNKQLNNYSSNKLPPTSNYLISPTKKKIGPKKTKSTFSILFPHSHLPMSFSWNNNLSNIINSPLNNKSTTTTTNKINKTINKQQIINEPTNEYFDEYKQTVQATDEFGEFIQNKQNLEFIKEFNNNKDNWQRKNSKRRKQSFTGGGQRLVNSILFGRWRSNSKNKYLTNNKINEKIETIVINDEQYNKKERKQKRSRSVGANQQMRISTTMCSGTIPMDSSEIIVKGKKNSCCSNGDEKNSLMFGNMSFFDDVHPAYWGFRTPQSETYYSCTGATEDEITKSPASSGNSSFKSNGNSLDVFKRIEILGEGSYATVWKSENRIDGSIVALKEIKLQEQEGLPFTAIREISLLRALKHANIVRLHQIIIQQPKALILVFEYMKTDLAKYLENYYPQGLEQLQIKVLLFQLLRGLAFCHERKILHRDLKPQNLLLSIDGELKLADFGLARAKSVPSRTYSHDVVTLWYRPPDVLLGSTIYSTSLDIWGVGCIFAEMCNGCALFPGANEVSDQLHKIFKIRGFPKIDFWPECVNLPKWSLFTFPNNYEEQEWLTIEPEFYKLGNEGLKLITQLLQLNPINRISAEGAMLHKYFDELPKTLHALLPNGYI
ncbi:hypothetical protein Mgra_00009896 [Meloidogyne graminicola]|uniref:cyclin-dependent kinase n=1 Tax=Meloidogyne graminicola TaxID=189291 RepID=A0A8S9ZAK2_9BILA|nr:hypothetical protein Mgra_00009896 [Meloidogyne graminicola]